MRESTTRTIIQITKKLKKNSKSFKKHTKCSLTKKKEKHMTCLAVPSLDQVVRQPGEDRETQAGVGTINIHIALRIFRVLKVFSRTYLASEENREQEEPVAERAGSGGGFRDIFSQGSREEPVKGKDLEYQIEDRL